MSKKDEALKLALSTLANARDWIGNDPEGRWNEDEMYDELCNMVKFVSEALAEQPAPPPECQTEAEKTAFAFGWWKALEEKRKADSALDRMADNARELGLDYEPPCKTGSQCTSKCQQCEQLAQDAAIKTLEHLGYTYHGGEQWKPPLGQLAQQQERKTSYEELERIADDLQELCDKQAIRLGKLEVQQQEPTFTFGEVERTMQALRKGTLEQQQAYEVMKDKPLYTFPPASKPWVGLTEFDIDQIPYSCSHADSRLIAFAIEAKLKEKNAQPSKSCEWQQEDSEYMPDTWRSDCGVLWTFTDGGPIENDMKHCCGCGAKLKERNT